MDWDIVLRADATSAKLGGGVIAFQLGVSVHVDRACLCGLIMGLFSAVGYLADSRLNSAFPSIDDLEENRVALENDSFNELRNSIPPSAQMVIFDQNGNRLYASDDDVAKSIDAKRPGNHQTEPKKIRCSTRFCSARCPLRHRV